MASGSAPLYHPMAPGAIPNPVEWMTKPGSLDGCPPGLEYLTSLDQLLVLRQVEVWTGIEPRFSYAVKNNQGQQCYSVYEESDIRNAMTHGGKRGFDMRIVDNTGQKIAHAHREFKGRCGEYPCCACCVDGETCASVLNVESPVGSYIGRIIQLSSNWNLRYAVQDSNNETVLIMEAPRCLCQCSVCVPEDEQFNILTADESTQIGTITHLYNGFAEDMVTNAANFNIKFPLDLDVKVKTVVLCAMLFVDVFLFGQDVMPSRNHN